MRLSQNSTKIIPNYIATGCTCAGRSNKYGEGSECMLYSGYNDDWYNGRWCYANVDSCSDAKAHPASEVQNVPGFGASRAACVTGKYLHMIERGFYVKV